MNHPRNAESLLNGTVWVNDPVSAHKAWRTMLRWSKPAGPDIKVEENEYAQHSNRLYVSLWGVFCRWMVERELDVTLVRSTDISEFLATRQGRSGAAASRRTVRTYLAEIDRVFEWLMADGQLISFNPAAPILEGYRQTHVIAATAEASEPGFLLRYEAGAEVLFQMEHEDDPYGWTPLRNLALRLVAGQCGLTLKELCNLVPENVDCVKSETIEVYAPGHRELKPRTLTGTRRLRQVMQDWIETRRILRIRPGWSRASAKGEDSQGQESVRLFVSSVYEGNGAVQGAGPRLSSSQVERILEPCVRIAVRSTGETAASNGARYLRTAFATELLLGGAPDSIVQHLMGLQTNFSVTEIRNAIRPQSLPSDPLVESVEAP